MLPVPVLSSERLVRRVRGSNTRAGRVVKGLSERSRVVNPVIASNTPAPRLRSPASLTVTVRTLVPSPWSTPAGSVVNRLSERSSSVRAESHAKSPRLSVEMERSVKIELRGERPEVRLRHVLRR